MKTKSDRVSSFFNPCGGSNVLTVRGGVLISDTLEWASLLIASADSMLHRFSERFGDDYGFCDFFYGVEHLLKTAKGLVDSSIPVILPLCAKESEKDNEI